METEIINKLYLELSQFTTAITKTELNLRQERDSLQREVYRYKKALNEIIEANPDNGLFMQETAKAALEGE